MPFAHNTEQVEHALCELMSVIQHIIKDSQQKVFWLSVDFRTLIASTGIKHTEAKEAAYQLLQRTCALLDDDMTLLISTFNFNFPQIGLFDPAKTEAQTGAFGALLLDSFSDHRVKQPFYSFLVFGAKKESLTREYIAHSTGKDSIFDWVVNHQTQLICIGHHYVKALSSIHHAEQEAGVDYRYVKTFKGQAVIDNTNVPTDVETSFCVRDLDTCDFSSLTLAGDNAFRTQNIVQSYHIASIRRPLIIHTLNHLNAHKLMVKNLLSEDTLYVDYDGPNHPCNTVITSKVADSLYREELSQYAQKVTEL